LSGWSNKTTQKIENFSGGKIDKIPVGFVSSVLAVG
jgi:hypothetical protein